MGRHADFWTVTQEALDVALATHDRTDTALRDALLAAYRELDAYPEVPEMLRRLKAHGIRTAILSNGSPAMLADAVGAAGLEPLLDAVLSIEEAGVYKPDPRVYQLVVDRLGVAPAAVSFQSSNQWDAAGAAAFGFQVVSVNRSGQPAEYGWVLRARTLADLDGLPALVRAG
jgi:2-haloacid dehalogenase